MPVVVASLTDLVDQLHEIFADEKVNVDYVQAVMSAYKSNVSEWKRFAKFDRFRYTRNLVDAGNGKFNLMILCWNEGQGSSIHDHSDSHCFMKVLHGSLREVRYPWPSESEEQRLEPLSTAELQLNDVCYINDSLGLHRVENPSHSETAVSLHLYCPPFEYCQMFDQRTGHRTRCPVTFWSKYGEKTDLNTCRTTVAIPEDN